MIDTLKRIAYHRLAPLGIVLIGATIAQVLAFSDWLHFIVGIVFIGAYGQDARSGGASAFPIDHRAKQRV